MEQHGPGPGAAGPLGMALLVSLAIGGCGGGGGGSSAPGASPTTVPTTVGPGVAAPPVQRADACDAPYFADKLGLYEGTFRWTRGFDETGTAIDFDPTDDRPPAIGACQWQVSLEVIREQTLAGEALCALGARVISVAEQRIVDGTSLAHECIDDDTVLSLDDPFALTAASSPPEPGVDFVLPLDMDYVATPIRDNRGPILGGSATGRRVSLFSVRDPLIGSLGFVPGEILIGDTDLSSDERLEGKLVRLAEELQPRRRSEADVP